MNVVKQNLSVLIGLLVMAFAMAASLRACGQGEADLTLKEHVIAETLWKIEHYNITNEELGLGGCQFAYTVGEYEVTHVGEKFKNHYLTFFKPIDIDSLNQLILRETIPWYQCDEDCQWRWMRTRPVEIKEYLPYRLALGDRIRFAIPLIDRP